MAGGNIFAHYSKDLQADFRRRASAAANSDDLWADTLYWPFEMSRSGKSNLLRDWLVGSGLTCGTISDIRVHDGSDRGIVDREARVLQYSKLPWLRLVRTAAEIHLAKRD